MKAGIHENLPFSEYLADPAIGFTSLWRLRKSPKEFQNYRKKKNKGTAATALGTIIHTLILEPAEFHNRYAVQPEDWGNKNSGTGRKAWDIFKKANHGKICLDYDINRIVAEIVDLMANHRALGEILSSGKAEVSAFTDEADGISLKARADWITEDGVIWDVKTTTKGLGFNSLDRTINNMGYHFQAAVYREVFSLFRPIRGYGWIFVDTSGAALDIVCRTAPAFLLEQGDEEFSKAYNVLYDCIKSGKWPRGQDDDIRILGEHFVPVSSLDDFVL